jgi:hypothetical protein
MLPLIKPLCPCLIDGPDYSSGICLLCSHWHWQGTFGIYTYLDFHQDSGSELFCGEGLPTWAVETQGAPGFPIPLEKVRAGVVAVPAWPRSGHFACCPRSIDAAACGAGVVFELLVFVLHSLLTALTRISVLRRRPTL